MSRYVDGVEVFSSFELIREFGTRVTDRRCGCCTGYTLYAIRYPDARATALLCSLCDVETDKRTAAPR